MQSPNILSSKFRLQLAASVALIGFECQQWFNFFLRHLRSMQQLDSPLHHAAARGHLDVMKFLIEVRKANVHAKNIVSVVTD
jgi:ankyrin repeat protein